MNLELLTPSEREIAARLEQNLAEFDRCAYFQRDDGLCIACAERAKEIAADCRTLLEALSKERENADAILRAALKQHQEKDSELASLRAELAAARYELEQLPKRLSVAVNAQEEELARGEEVNIVSWRSMLEEFVYRALDKIDGKASLGSGLTTLAEEVDELRAELAAERERLTEIGVALLPETNTLAAPDGEEYVRHEHLDFVAAIKKLRGERLTVHGPEDAMGDDEDVCFITLYPSSGHDIKYGAYDERSDSCYYAYGGETIQVPRGQISAWVRYSDLLAAFSAWQKQKGTTNGANTQGRIPGNGFRSIC